jgi:hypothetical protein
MELKQSLSDSETEDAIYLGSIEKSKGSVKNVNKKAHQMPLQMKGNSFG